MNVIKYSLKRGLDSDIIVLVVDEPEKRKQTKNILNQERIMNYEKRSYYYYI